MFYLFISHKIHHFRIEISFERCRIRGMKFIKTSALSSREVRFPDRESPVHSQKCISDQFPPKCIEFWNSSNFIHSNTLCAIHELTRLHENDEYVLFNQCQLNYYLRWFLAKFLSKQNFSTNHSILLNFSPNRRGQYKYVTDNITFEYTTRVSPNIPVITNITSAFRFCWDFVGGRGWN